MLEINSPLNPWFEEHSAGAAANIEELRTALGGGRPWRSGVAVTVGAQQGVGGGRRASATVTPPGAWVSRRCICTEAPGTSTGVKAKGQKGASIDHDPIRRGPCSGVEQSFGRWNMTVPA
jgi:hypothetical protein